MHYSLQFIALAISKAQLLLTDMKWHREASSAPAVEPHPATCTAAPVNETSPMPALPATHTISDATLRAPGSACSGVPPYAAPHLRMPLAYVRDSLAAVLDVLRNALSDPYIAQRGGLQGRAPPGVPCDSSAGGVNVASGAASGADGGDGSGAASVEEALVPHTAVVSGRDAASQHVARHQRVAPGIKACIAAAVSADRLLTTELSWSGMQVASVVDVIAASITAP